MKRRFKEGRLVFYKIGNEKVLLWNLMMNGYAKICDFKEMTRDVISWNSMISGYVASGFFEKGVKLLKEMLYLRFDMDLATMVSVLQACANCGHVSSTKEVHGFGVKAYVH
ncbi:unnamed protein product [Dovyalis caffra]|uniref:Pentatricopeptide repeat-containing protein n=1 Tax=Dovyalis caffra TaxID=77055 RepID=A0AAV1S9F8_9ROSI|nr:unnamed protein product [Dovyalis caffra]